MNFLNLRILPHAERLKARKILALGAQKAFGERGSGSLGSSLGYDIGYSERCKQAASAAIAFSRVKE